MAMMDYRDFTRVDDPVPQPTFIDPGIAPPSYIFATGQLSPPYDLSAETLEPFPGCDVNFAQLCAVQHAIRLVTRARVDACPDIEAGGTSREHALGNISAGEFTEPGTSGFGVFVVSEDGAIIADALQPQLIGERIDGLKNSGLVAQPTLRDYIDWVTRWGGGFVPHYSTRISKVPPDVVAGDPPLPVSTYFEKCSSGERIGVTIGREPLLPVENCNPNANGFCAMQNIRRLVGMNLLDILNTNSYETMNDQFYKISYKQDYSVGSFYTFRYQLSWWGYPGPDQYYNPGPLPDNSGTCLGIGAGLHKVINGRNVTNVLGGTVDGLPRGDWLLAVLNNAAWKGGAWQDYAWWIPALGDHFKVSLVVGYVWNGTAVFNAAGTVHKPETAALGPLRADCVTSAVWPCSVVNSMRLLSHAQMDFLTPGGNFDRLSNMAWFGASHSVATDNGGVDAGTWPSGFYVWGFDYNGTCVADGSNPSNIGLDVSVIFGSGSLAHSLFMTVADNGGGWVQYTKSGGGLGLAQVIKLARWGRFFYLATSISKVWNSWQPDCTSDYSEPCSEANAQVIVGAAVSDILAAATLSELEVVAESFSARSGEYAEAHTGDFQVHLYSGDPSSPFACPGLGSATCPPVNLEQRLLEVKDVAVKEDGGWVNLIGTSKGDVQAFVFPVVWSPPTSNAKRRFYVVTFVGSYNGPLRCTSKEACPANAHCSSNGRCACDSGFNTNFTVDETASAELKPASMACIDVRGLDCSSAAGSSGCSACVAGSFCPEGSPLPCPKGQFCPAGSEQPSLCPPGSFGDETRASTDAACKSCQPGFFTGNGGQTECEECPPGRFTTTSGTTQCQPCEAAEYQPASGATSCLPCQAVIAGSRSQVKGADRAEDCVCPEGFFLSVGSTSCEVCKEGMSCAVGSDMRNYDTNGGSTGPVPQLLPGFWSSIAEPLNIFQCRTEQNCPGGNAGTCGAHLQDIACAKCVSDWYWDGESCVECGMADITPAVFPLIPILVGLALPIVQYFLLSEPYERWGSLTATAGSLLFVLLNHYQIIDIIGSTNVKIPARMESTYDTWGFTNDLMSIFKTACNGLTNLRDIMLLKALSPFALGVATVFDFFVANAILKLLRKTLRIDVNMLFNGYGSVMFTFFGAIAAMSMELWKCMQNPNGKRTMFSDASVICFDSDQWLGMLGISLAAVMVYVLIAGAVMVRAIIRAHHRFHDEAFRNRWKFLFEKYRLGAWWFGLAFLAKNFLVNLALVIFPVPCFQFYFIALVVGIYMVLVMLVWPYRAHWPNRVEVLCSASICFNCMFMSSFTFLRETDGNEKVSVSNVASAVTYLPLAMGGLVLVYLRAFGILEDYNIAGFGERAVARRKALHDQAARVQASFSVLASLKPADLHVLYDQTGEYEHWLLGHAQDILSSELRTDLVDTTASKGARSPSASPKKQISTQKLGNVELPITGKELVV